MKPLASVAMTVLLASAVAAQPERTRLYSTPGVPPRDVLERLNLREAWSRFVPMDSRRDGILSSQIIPLRQGKDVSYQLLVQTRSGLVTILDAETGQTLWRTRVGDPYKGTYAAGYNNTDVFVERGTSVFGLSRTTGDVRWRLDLAAGVTTAPLAAPRALFLCFNTSEVAYYDLPNKRNLKPRLFRTYRSPLLLQLQPAATDKFLVYPSPSGSVSVLFKDIPGQFVRFRTESKLLATVGVHEIDESVYIGSRDTYVYGNPILAGEPAWRFATGGAVLRPPFVNDDDVYVAGEKVGLFRLRRRTLDGPQFVAYLDRLGAVGPVQLQEVTKELGPRARDAATVLSTLQRKGYLSNRQKEQLAWRGGDAVWKNVEGDSVLAVNKKFVYATDTGGRLLILDRARGTRLSRYNLSDFVVPVVNELTDRLYLAANSGLIVCLHDRDREYATPVRMKRVLAPPPAVPPGKGRKPPAPPALPPK